MAKPIFKSLTLEEARGRVATEFDIAPDEAEQCIKVWCCFEGLTLIGPGGSRITVKDDAKLDFESSTLLPRGRQTRAISEDCPDGEWEHVEIPVRVRREDLDQFIRGTTQVSKHASGHAEDGKQKVFRVASELEQCGDQGGVGFAARIHEKLGSPESPNLETVKKYVRELDLDPRR